MKCISCGVKISAEFIHAIKKNECPACSNHIMAQDSLAGFLGLKELLKGQVTDVDKIAGLIVANFDVKQRFVAEVIESSVVESLVVQDNSPEADARERAKIMEQKKLQKLRDEALEEARYQAKLAAALSDNPSPDDEDTDVEPKKESRGNLAQTRQQVYASDEDLDLDKVESLLASRNNRRGPVIGPGYKGPKISRTE